MRHRFDSNPTLQVIAIEKIQLPTKSRDELPPTLAGLQWIWCHATLKQQIFELLEKKILGDKQPTGRTGMDLWQILVLGVTRLALDADWDRMEHLANYDSLLRQMLGVPQTPWGEEDKMFHHQTLRDNVALLDDALLHEINALVAAAGRAEFKKKCADQEDPLAIKVDTYVLETDVHFPTDLNLLLDGGRKCLDLLEKYRDQFGYQLPGWRKLQDWQGRLKSSERATSKSCSGGGGKDKEKHVESATREYLQIAREISLKVSQSLCELCEPGVEIIHWDALAYFHEMLDKHIDLVDRRLLQKETIPSGEKVYSLFEPHTEWINKGKRNVELGHRILIAADQDQLIHHYEILINEVDMGQSVSVADHLVGRYGEGRIRSMSFDKGFTSAQDRELLDLFIPTVIMPKRGKKNAAEQAAEQAARFVKLRHEHSAVESAINGLEQHGLNRCLDVGLKGYSRYVGLGVLAYNLHFIGRRLVEKRRAVQLAA